MNFKKLFFYSLITLLTGINIFQFNLLTAMAYGSSPVSGPVSAPISKPISAPIATPIPAGFSNLSANLNSTNATFNFSFSGNSSNYIVDLSTYADMSWDVYLSFGTGTKNPIQVLNPKKWDKYQCGKTLYWKVYNSSRTISSPIQKVIINCANPVPTIFPKPSASASATPKPTPVPTPVPVKYNIVAGTAYYKVPKTFRWYKRTYTYYVYSPASNTQVRLSDTKSAASYLTKTDRWGYFNLRVANSTYKVNVSDVTNSAFQPNNFTINVNRFIWLFFSATSGGYG